MVHCFANRNTSCRCILSHRILIVPWHPIDLLRTYDTDRKAGRKSIGQTCRGGALHRQTVPYKRRGTPHRQTTVQTLRRATTSARACGHILWYRISDAGDQCVFRGIVVGCKTLILAEPEQHLVSSKHCILALALSFFWPSSNRGSSYTTSWYKFVTPHERYVREYRTFLGWAPRSCNNACAFHGLEGTARKVCRIDICYDTAINQTMRINDQGRYDAITRILSHTPVHVLESEMGCGRPGK